MVGNWVSPHQKFMLSALKGVSGRLFFRQYGEFAKRL